ncbi:GNAT family N-acetyltransferase [Maritimibacter dapengensis]|uniref:GNAT family N-acetyltransferase n=1 Tax=Maritimibacter dapengensis TaxID=2836868 RepID=A0ABS6SYJ6_9RHOB|nr:GNAT family N-acetyltransferase [Maritimibacter dapengensis]MBV7377366.1 GNAT family N-acetyltransferase [Maritimibacter dapengensis]
MIRLATSADLAAMADVTMRSKAHWGYSQAFLDACRDELSATEDDLGPNLAVWDDGAIRGVAHVTIGADVAELELLFVDPVAMGRGIGAALFDWACARARACHSTRLGLDADPFAEPFYLRKGMQRVGDAPSATWPDRMLPRMEIAL